MIGRSILILVVGEGEVPSAGHGVASECRESEWRK